MDTSKQQQKQNPLQEQQGIPELREQQQQNPQRNLQEKRSSEREPENVDLE